MSTEEPKAQEKTSQCRYYNRGSCKYGNKCWFMHDDSLRTKFQDDLKGYEEHKRRCKIRYEEHKRKHEENKHKHEIWVKNKEYEIKKREIEREQEEREEREREFKSGEWNMIVNYHFKEARHDGYCSDAGSLHTESEDCCIIRKIPSYVKSEHLKDFVVVDKYIIDKLCFSYGLVDNHQGSGYCGTDCGWTHHDIHFEIRPTEERMKRLLMPTKLNENLIELIQNIRENNTKNDESDESVDGWMQSWW